MGAPASAPPAAKPGRKNSEGKVNKDESKSARFSRIASARVAKAVKMISLIENLNGPGYEYSDQQRAHIHELLAEAVNRVDVALAAKRDRKTDAPTIRI